MLSVAYLASQKARSYLYAKAVKNTIFQAITAASSN
jgi:hypothetical protein